MAPSRRATLGSFFAGIALVLTLSSVAAAAEPVAAAAATRSGNSNTWLLHLPGMGGLMGIDRAVTQGMLSGGVDARLEIYDWTGPDRGLVALGNVTRHNEQAKIVADKIVSVARGADGAPAPKRIIITAHSAGTGIAVWALEQLPDDVMIDDLVLIASALSPGYDLSRALKHVRHKAWAFNSALDLLVLGTGCKMFGTVDRVNTDAAGRIGFALPEQPAVQGQYEKFEQIPYDNDWMRFGNNGEHIGAMHRAFARNVIARVLKGEGLPPRAATRPATRKAA